MDSKKHPTKLLLSCMSFERSKSMPCLLHTAEDPIGRPLTREELDAFVREHNSLHSNDSGYFEDLIKPFVCKNLIACCPGARIERAQGKRTGKCSNCKKKISVTAGTFLEGKRKFKVWHFAIWMRERGISLSSNMLAELAEISTSTAWHIRRTLAELLDKMPKEFWTVYSGHFLALIAKRSRETPAREHPRAEQEVADVALAVGTTDGAGVVEVNQRGGESADSSSMTAPEAHSFSDQPLDENEALVLGLLSNEQQHFDHIYRFVESEMTVGELSAHLTYLELRTLVVRWVGDWYSLPPAPAPANVITQPELTQEQKFSATAFIAFVEKVHGTISRKHLQSYLSDFAYFTDRAGWQNISFLDTCFDYGRIEPEDLMNVTPLMVRLTQHQASWSFQVA